MHKPFIRTILEAIKANPDNVDMSDWYMTLDDKGIRTTEDNTHYCKTTACIAGWAIFLDTNSADTPIKKSLADTSEWYPKRAATLMDISWTLASVLFYRSSWPLHYVVIDNDAEAIEVLLNDLLNGGIRMTRAFKKEAPSHNDLDFDMGEVKLITIAEQDKLVEERTK